MPPKTREIKFGSHVFRVVATASGFQGIVVGDGKNRFSAKDEAARVAQLTNDVLRQDRSFIGFDGARRRFLRLFPGGFSDPAFVGSKSEGELFYKRAMASWLSAEAPHKSVLDGEVDGPTVLRAFQRTNLVDAHTKAKLSTVLKGSRSKRLVEVLARFARGDVAWACETVAEFANDGVGTWPVLTYLAFFWHPAEHAFLKPEFTKEYARRVGHRFAVNYSSKPEPATYYHFLDMLDETQRHVLDLGPSDYIDLHSFMWAVCMYDEADTAQ